ncbi:hypothetical protein D3C80_1687290 [compost metagenome]
MQVEHCQIHSRDVAVVGMGILDIFGVGDVAIVGAAVWPAYFTAAVAAQWQAQVHVVLVREVVDDFQRCRRRQVAGDVEHRAVGHDAPSPGNGDLAKA